MVDGMRFITEWVIFWRRGYVFVVRIIKNRLQLNVLYSFIHILCLLVKYLLLLFDYRENVVILEKMFTLYNFMNNKVTSCE